MIYVFDTCWSMSATLSSGGSSAKVSSKLTPSSLGQELLKCLRVLCWESLTEGFMKQNIASFRHLPRYRRPGTWSKDVIGAVHSRRFLDCLLVDRQTATSHSMSSCPEDREGKMATAKREEVHNIYGGKFTHRGETR